MEDNSVQKVIITQVQSLIQHCFPSKLGKDEQQKYLAYFLRVLSSRIYSYSIEDEHHITALIRKRVAKLNGKASETAKLARLQTLFDKLFSSRVISKRWAVLYALYTLSEDSSGAAQFQSVIQESLGSKMLMKVQSPTEDMVIDSREDSKDMEAARRALGKEVGTAMGSAANKVNCKFNAGSRISWIVFGNVSEEDVLRDLLFVFQGIDGKYISYSILDDTYSVSASVLLER